MLAFEKAWQFGAHMIELDVHETVDGHLVCIHDATIDRTTNGSGEVRSLTLDEIQDFDAGQGQKVPLLKDVLEFSHGKIQVNIELKVVGVEDRIASLLSEMDLYHDVMVSSFIHLPLSEIREIDERIRIAILTETDIENFSSYAHELGVHAVNPRQDLISERMVSDFHELGIKVYPWTVNDEKTMENLLSIGVDGLITDHPEIGIMLVDSKFNQ